MSLIKKSLILLVFFFLIYSCAKKDEEKNKIITKDDKDWLPRVEDRTARAQAEGKGLLGKKGIFGGNSESSGGTIKFANTNVMWKATLKTLENIPLVNVDYAGGIIVTDWYGGSIGTNDNTENYQEIKITVKFTSDEIKSNSFDVISHKRTCVKNKCSVKLGEELFNNKIKDKIIETTRSVSLAEAKKK